MARELSDENRLLEHIARSYPEHNENQDQHSSSINMQSDPVSNIVSLYKIWKAIGDLVHHIADNVNKVIEGRGTPLNDKEFVGEVGLVGIATGAAVGAGTAMGIGADTLSWAASGALYGAIDGPIVGGLLAAAAEYSVRDR
jgi:hypothetical protein